MMLTQYTPATAATSILRRTVVFETNVPDALAAGIEARFGERLTPEAAVTRIIRDVVDRGDAALTHWSNTLDNVALTDFRVSQSTIAAAKSEISADLYTALEAAAARIRTFHQQQPLPNWTMPAGDGQLGQRVTPIARVGAYVPAGTAPLPSSLLMSAIPAQVAGVQELVVATPPRPDGTVSPIILAAAAVAGVSEIYMLGGAQAIAALAFGTDSVRAVDKIVGPGGLFVTLAKRQVFGAVGIDGLYGPTETMVIADENANPEWIAADLIAQAEHDVLASAILLTPSQTLADAVNAAITRQVAALPARQAIATAALTTSSGIVITDDLAEACMLADRYAPEHLCLSVDEPHALVPLVQNAGGLFIGEHSFEVLGDYIAGPSHTMPTSGTARFSSPLNVYDFIKINSIIDLDPATAAALSGTAAALATAEGLHGHANAARLRMADKGDAQ